MVDDTTTRRKFLAGVPAVALAGTALSLPGVHDPILALLTERRALVDEMNARTGDDDIDDHPNWNRVEELDDAIIGTPILSVAGAYAAMKTVEAEDCSDDADRWLLSAVTDFLRGQVTA